MPRDDRAPATMIYPPDVEVGTPAELRAVWGTLMCCVPLGVDRRLLAQRLADQLFTLTRPATSETYPAALDVFVPSGVGGYEDLEHYEPVLFLQAWVKRPWGQDHEWRNVVADLSEAVTAWLGERYPLPVARRPTLIPLPPVAGKRLHQISEFAAHGSATLPPGWADYLARHRPQ
jgi:hypothetical protein